MNSALPVKTIAGMFALAGFAVALIAGIAAGNSATRVMVIAVASLFLCQVVGVLAGAVLDRVVREHLDSQSSTSHAPPREHARAPAG